MKNEKGTIVLAGGVIGLIAAILVFFGNPANMGFGNMPNISMMDLSSIPNQVSEKQRVKKKKKTEEKQELKNDKNKKAEEKEDYVTVTASSVEELLKKINDTIYDSMSDHVKTPQEQLLGQHINFSA